MLEKINLKRQEFFLTKVWFFYQKTSFFLLIGKDRFAQASSFITLTTININIHAWFIKKKKELVLKTSFSLSKNTNASKINLVKRHHCLKTSLYYPEKLKDFLYKYRGAVLFFLLKLC